MHVLSGWPRGNRFPKPCTRPYQLQPQYSTTDDVCLCKHGMNSVGVRNSCSYCYSNMHLHYYSLVIVTLAHIVLNVKPPKLRSWHYLENIYFCKPHREVCQSQKYIQCCPVTPECDKKIKVPYSPTWRLLFNQKPHNLVGKSQSKENLPFWFNCAQICVKNQCCRVCVFYIEGKDRI